MLEQVQSLVRQVDRLGRDSLLKKLSSTVFGRLDDFSYTGPRPAVLFIRPDRSFLEVIRASTAHKAGALGLPHFNIRSLLAVMPTQARSCLVATPDVLRLAYTSTPDIKEHEIRLNTMNSTLKQEAVFALMALRYATYEHGDSAFIPGKSDPGIPIIKFEDAEPKPDLVEELLAITAQGLQDHPLLLGPVEAHDVSGPDYERRFLRMPLPLLGICIPGVQRHV